MSTDSSQKKDRTLVITLITVLGSIFVAFLTTYRAELAPIFFKALTPTPTTTITVSPTVPPSVISTDTPPVQANLLSPAIQTMDQYYKYINNAGISDDLIRAWNLMTVKLQCNPSDQCNFENYRNWWWKQQVQYKLYDCGLNIVDTELIYYSRNTLPNLNKKPDYVRYELIEENGHLKLNSGDIVTGVSAYCELAVSVP